MIIPYPKISVSILGTLATERTKNLIALFCSGLLFWTSLTALLPTLPTYIADIGGTPYQVGLVMGCFAIGLLLFRAPLGRVADRRSRKLVVLIGAAVVGTAPLGYLLFESIPILGLIRGFHGISIAAFTIGYSTLVVDWSPPEKKGELIGYMSLVVPIGLAVGPALGGLLQATVGYAPLFWGSAGAGYASLLCASQVKAVQRREPRGQSQAVVSESFWRLVISPRLRVPTAALLLIGLAFGTLVAFLPLYVRELEWGFNAGVYYSMAAIASFCARLVVGRASDRYGRGVFITGSLCGYGLAMLLLATARHPLSLILAAIAQGTGGGILIPLMTALMADRSTANERGQVYALCLGGFDLGIALAGPMLGLFASVVGYRGLFFIATSLATLALIIFMTLSSKSVSHSFRFATGREQDIYAISER